MTTILGEFAACSNDCLFNFTLRNQGLSKAAIKWAESNGVHFYLGIYIIYYIAGAALILTSSRSVVHKNNDACFMMPLQVRGRHRNRKQFQLNTKVWVRSQPTSERPSIPFPRYKHSFKSECDFWEGTWSDISKNRLSCTVRLLLQLILAKNRPLRQEGTIWPIFKAASYF